MTVQEEPPLGEGKDVGGAGVVPGRAAPAAGDGGGGVTGGGLPTLSVLSSLNKMLVPATPHPA